MPVSEQARESLVTEGRGTGEKSNPLGSGPPRPLQYGDIAHDREDTAPDDLVIIARPDRSISEWDVPGGETVADDNPDYPPDAPVVVGMFRDTLKAYLPDWREQNGPLSLEQISEGDGAYYSFPEPRLELVQPATETLAGDLPHDRPSAGADADRSSDTSAAPAEGEGAETDTTPSDETADEPEPEPEPEPPEPTGSLRALKERLEDGGMTVTPNMDGETLTASKIGESYVVKPGEVVDEEAAGDRGALRDRLEEIVAEYTDE